jgi:hypothetical protein
VLLLPFGPVVMRVAFDLMRGSRRAPKESFREFQRLFHVVV